MDPARYNPNLPKKKNALPLSFSVCFHSFLSAGLAAMPVFSKIPSPTLASDGYDWSPGNEYRHEISLSPPPTRTLHQNSFEGHRMPQYHPASTSTHTRNARFSGSASGQVARNSAGARLLQNPPPSQRSHSYISISSDDPDPDATELIALRKQNIELKYEVKFLQGRIEAMSYVLVTYIIFHTDREAVRDSYDTLLESIGGKIDKTREDVKNMVEQISINFTGAIPEVKSSDVLKREDYPEVQYWTLDSWLKIRTGASIIEADSPTLSIFFEDESGVTFPKAIRDAVRNNVSAFWDGMLNGGEVPKNWNKTSLARKEEFRATLEGKYPWLRLCEANWKTNHLWINYFRTWKIGRFGKNAAKKVPKAPANPTDRDGIPVIEVETSDSDISVGSKRKREDLIEPMSPKRPREQLAENPVAPPARPQARKKVAKVAKVGTLSSPLDQNLLKASQLDPLYLFFTAVSTG